jgi:hypothetical protein
VAKASPPCAEPSRERPGKRSEAKTLPPWLVRVRVRVRVWVWVRVRVRVRVRVGPLGLG